ncbi:hypothetical protein BZA05DRAFT_397378 [Tricharina praecox]|uniref:uncharacterized protein n=1 Tax=Tricharina praecox TaxID=43433 RepID=UPI0022201111|nr:uncharacterized protein BZA05DRAFT_397378 [Tricharina praecox]KAI5852270.1 hypothetical protein BZA05DRAFT_397378 [Tricharina praecox]
MSSSTASTPNIPGKPGGSSAGAPSPQPAPQPPSNVAGGEPSRRAGGGSGTNSGAGSNARNGTPRNNQSSRKGHRNHRKPDSVASEENSYIGYDEVVTSPATNRKGTSIAINWDYSTPHPRAYGEFRPRTQRRAPAWGLGSGYHAVDKARYVNANYRFIVNPHGDYRAQCIDSDVHLPWDHILQILASALTQCPNCPICLSTPVAPRMAKCGHIFCLPCLDRYMASADGNKPVVNKPRYKKCVICTDSVYMTDIRPVRFFTGRQTDPPKEGDDVVLRLVMRMPGSTLALPRDGADPPSALDEIPWYFAEDVMDYARIMKGSEDYMMKQFNREIVELQEMQLEDEVMFGEDGIWARKAIETIRMHMEALIGIGNPPPSIVPQREKEKQKEKRPPIVFSENTDDVPLMYHVMHEARSGHSSSSHTPKPGPPDADDSISAVELSLSLIEYEEPRQRTAGAGASSDSPYLFYQALLHHYLSPLDIRILKVTFGSFANFPSTVLPRVENVSTGHTVDDDLRKRARYLAHLPYGCEVTFLECDWTDIVPLETLEKFKSDIERRRKRKRDKETKEERDRVRAEKIEEDEKWSTLRYRRRESTGFLKEKFKDEDFVALGHSELVDNEAVAETSPSQATESSANALHQRTVWGTPAIAGSQEESAHLTENNSGWLPDWERELLLDEEMMAQIEMEGSMGNGGGSGSGGRAPSHGKGQKKKKFKKVTLMTNGGKRGA